MTQLVATVLADTPDELYAQAREAARHADWIEIRLDGPSGLPWDLRAFFSFDKPCIATLRHALDGGRSHADDAARADVLRRAMLAGAAAIDVEAWSDELRPLVREAKERGVRVIVSRHDLDGTPTQGAMLDALREARRAGADHAKLATTVRSPADAAALVDTALAARAEGLPAALMAVNDPFLRLLAPSLGLTLAYGAVPGRPPAAPGQVALDALRATHAAQVAPSSHARAVFLLGHPVAHSKSPRMQAAAFRAAGIPATYVALDVDEIGLEAALHLLRHSDALGANVTVPHKETAAKLVEPDETARRIGAVNTIVAREGKLTGHNTDAPGALDALREAGIEPAGQRALLLGAGGTARALAHALAEAGARVTIANRTRERADAIARATGTHAIDWEGVAEASAQVDIVLNATTVGLHDDASPLDVARLPASAAVLDAVYREGGTRLVREARARGLRTVAGEAMLLHQGARAFTLWTGRPAPIAAMRAALEGRA